MRILATCLLLSFTLALRAEAPKFFVVQFTVGEAWVADKPANEQAHFAAHSANLKRLRTEGKLLLGGRYADTGMIIVKAASLEEVRAELEKDPSIANHTFNAVVHPFAPFYDGCVERGK